MSILNDATLDEMEQKNEDLSADLDEQPQPSCYQSGAALPQFDFSFLKTPTGSGTIESYLDHVLNPGHSKGLAQMLRGFTGIAGELNLAILDITFGAFEYLKENKKAKPQPQQANNNGVNLYERPIINP